MFDLSFPIILSTFVVIFLAELPDKTSLASLVLATKYKAQHVILGAWLAFLVQTVIAVFAGSLLTLLPATPVHVAAGLGFLVFALLAFRRKEEAKEAEEKKEIAKSHKPAWITAFLVIFAAEWGDLTQLATAALVARIGHPLSISIGAIAALWSVTVLAAFAGAQLSKWLTPKVLNMTSGFLFGIIGIIVIVTAFIK
jgi:putative Ca2+/H+ antiporter (TMEM165/GDT1 family)